MPYQLAFSNTISQDHIANDVLSLLITQTWQVTLLIVIVWVAVRLFATDRPHLAHALWVLVLLKCLMPPVWSSPVSPFSWFGSQPNSSADVAQIQPDETSVTATRLRLETIVVRIDQDQKFRDDSIVVSTKPTADKSSHPANEALVATSSKRNWQSLLAMTWVIGAAIGLAVTLLRFALFWCWVRKSARVVHPHIEMATQRLAKKLGVRRNVRVVVADQPVGPAVLGLIRPTILLPAAIVNEKTESDLEPLLAHELIHIRRGDLWWAMVQTLATSLFWFHPLVWFAVRMVTRESERSCDEETVTSLGCQPATYARGLLEVLERKNQLRVAPALPGVRPVDITSARLERVMKLGNGSHRRTPVWIWLVLSICGATVLPGAAIVLAQEQSTPLKTINESEASRPLKKNSQEPQYSVKSPEVVTERPNQNPIEPLPTQQPTIYTSDQAKPSDWKHQKHDVSQLIKTIADSTGEPDSASAYLISNLLPPVFLTPPFLSTTHVVEPIVVEPIDSARPSMRIVDGILDVYGSEKHHKECAEMLAEYRNVGFKQIVVETRMVTMPQEQMWRMKIGWTVVLTADATSLELNENGEYDATQLPPTGVEFALREFDAENFEKLNPIGTVSSTSIVERNSPVMYAVINKKQADEFIQQSKGYDDTNIMQAPTVTMFNGQTASVRDGKERPFVVAVKRIEEPGTQKVAYQPVIRVIGEGNTVNLKAELKDETTLKLNCEMTNLEILKVDTAVLPTPEGNKRVSIQIPEIAKTQIRSSLEMESGKTVVLNCLQSNNKGEQESLLVMLRCVVIDTLTQTAVTASAEEPTNESGAAKVSEAAYFHFEPSSTELKTQSNVSDDSATDSIDLFIKASGNSNNESGKPETIEVMGMRIQMDGDVKYSINNQGVLIEGKGGVTCVTPEDDEFKISGDEGRVELREDKSGGPIFQFKFNGKVNFQMGDGQMSADAIEFNTAENKELPSVILTGNASITQETTTVSADEIIVDGLEMMTLRGNGHYLHKYDEKQPPINIHADQIRWNPETGEIDATQSDKQKLPGQTND